MLLLDQAGWHTTKTLAMSANITLLPLPARSPDLNPVENLWQFMRDNWLGNRVFKSYADILDHCCHAWNTRIDRPWRIMSIGLRPWVLINEGWYQPAGTQTGWAPRPVRAHWSPISSWRMRASP